MTALIWMLTWLPQVLSAMSKPPQPINLNIISSHFHHVLKWEPGPGTPPGVYYRVSVGTETGSSWVAVAGCEHVQHPLVCNVTQAFPDPQQVYFTQVTAMLEARPSLEAFSKGFKPIRDTDLDLPLLTVTLCGENLCVDLHPPREHLRKIYELLHYKLRIQYNSVIQEQESRFEGGEILEHLAPGRRYCVSVCFSDRLVSRMTNYSRPECVSTPANYSPDAPVAVVLCLLMICVVVLSVPLVYVRTIRRSLPWVLTSVRHMEGLLFLTPSTNSLASLDATAPSADQKRSSQASSDDSDEERETEDGGGSTGGGAYQLRAGADLGSSSSVSSPSAPEPELAPRTSSNQTSDSSKGETPSSAGLKRALNDSPPCASLPPADSLTGDEPKEEEEEEEEDVNLLTLVFGRCEEEVDETPSEDAALILATGTSNAEEAALETASCSEEEEEEEEDTGYMRRPSTRVLQTFS